MFRFNSSCTTGGLISTSKNLSAMTASTRFGLCQLGAARPQFVEIDRLDQVVVGAGFETRD